MGQHRFERVVEKAAARFERVAEEMSRDMMGEATTAPFTRKLTEKEQLEIYAAMDNQKWEAIIKEYGLSEALRYSEHMKKLMDKYYPPASKQQPIFNVRDSDFGASAPRSSAPWDAAQQQSALTDQMMTQALQSAGVDPQEVGL